MAEKFYIIIKSIQINNMNDNSRVIIGKSNINQIMSQSQTNSETGNSGLSENNTNNNNKLNGKINDTKK